MLGPHSCQLQRDLRIRSGNNITGQERQAKESFLNASFREESSCRGLGLEGSAQGSCTQQDSQAADCSVSVDRRNISSRKQRDVLGWRGVPTAQSSVLWSAQTTLPACSWDSPASLSAIMY